MYEILLSSTAVHDYKKIPDKELEKINKAIDSLETNPRPQDIKNFRIEMHTAYEPAITGLFMKLKTKD